jgi:hypothetical protein
MPMGIGLGIGVTRGQGVRAVITDADIIAIFNGGLAGGGYEGGYYRVSDLTTIFEDRGGAAATTPATVDGFVGTIKDKGPNARHLIPPSDAARGVLRFVGGLYYVETDGVDDQYPASMANTDVPPHYFAVAASKPTAGVQVSQFMRRANSTNYVTMRETTAEKLQLTRRLAALGPTSATSTASLVGFSLREGLARDTDENVAINGAAFETNSHASDVTGMLGALAFNRASTGQAEAVVQYWAGGIYINREPSAAQRASIITRVGEMAGLSL